MKPTLAILAGHHGRGTGSSAGAIDEWALAHRDALELYLQLDRDGIITPALEPIAEDNTPGELNPRERAAAWALKHKPAAVIELHYDSFETSKPAGHSVCSNRLTPFAEVMDRALDALPNPHRSMIIDAGFQIPRLLDPIPCVLLEPAFIFEPIIETCEWRPMLVAAIKAGLYKYFAGEDLNA
jgi:N-acetylmuramoyl-L-alanine amidase